MGSVGKRTRVVAAVLAVLAVAVAAAAAVGSMSGQERAVLLRPWAGEVRYEPVEGDQLCAGIGWDRLAADSGISVGEVETRRTSPTSGHDIACELDELEADFLDENFDTQHLGDLLVIVFDGPSEAYSLYRLFTDVASDQYRGFADEAIDGWWTQGRSLADSGMVRDGSDAVIYQIHHSNLYLALMLYGVHTGPAPMVDRLHEFARAVVDEARAQLPCRPLTGVPAAACE